VNLLKEIEGCKGEKLTSGLMRYLLLASQTFREGFANLLSKQTLKGRERITFENGIIVRAEFPTYKKKADNERETELSGYVDLCIEADNHVIFIENKIWAGFQEDQPEKYLDALKGMASGTTTEQLNGSNEGVSAGKQGVLVLCCPEFRKEEAQNKLKELKDQTDREWLKTGVLFWQQIRDLLTEENLQRESIKVQVIGRMFADYIESHLYDKISLPNANEESLTLMAEPIANRTANMFQRDLVRKVRDMLDIWPDIKTGNLAPANDWHGFYFYFLKKDEDGDRYSQREDPEGWCWFGFWNTADGKSILVIQTTAEFAGEHDHFKKTTRPDRRDDKDRLSVRE